MILVITLYYFFNFVKNCCIINSSIILEVDEVIDNFYGLLNTIEKKVSHQML